MDSEAEFGVWLRENNVPNPKAARREVLRKMWLSEVNGAADVPELPWDHVSAHRDDYVESDRDPARGARREVLASSPNLAHRVARVRQLMIAVLIEEPTANLTSPGFRSLLAAYANLDPGTLSNWFVRSGTSLRRVVRELLPEVVEDVARQHRVNSSTHA